MDQFFEKYIRPIIHTFGIDIVKHKGPVREKFKGDFSEMSIDIYEAVKPFTMTSPERVNAIVEATHYVVENKIEGDIVETGIWKGGSSMAMALTLLKLGDTRRNLYLYDTFSGMTAPTDEDVSTKGEMAGETFSKKKTGEDASDWCMSQLDEVKENVLGTGYPKEKVHFVEGKVEETIPKTIPKDIAVLRLDTDWYESTKHEMNHLFPLLKQYGVLILDDYGHWKGSRKAIDEYLSANQVRPLLNRIDYSGRMAIKT